MTTETKRYGWTQPCCDFCWNKFNPDKEPYRFKQEHREVETCVHCGDETESGIYIRVDPREAKYPTLEK